MRFLLTVLHSLPSLTLIPNPQPRQSPLQSLDKHTSFTYIPTTHIPTPLTSSLFRQLLLNLSLQHKILSTANDIQNRTRSQCFKIFNERSGGAAERFRGISTFR